jgi:hypothetical protein
MGTTTTRCGGRQEAAKIGRCWFAEGMECGIDQSGLPPRQRLRGLPVHRRDAANIDGIGSVPCPLVRKDIQRRGRRRRQIRRRLVNAPPDSRARPVIGCVSLAGPDGLLGVFPHRYLIPNESTAAALALLRGRDGPDGGRLGGGVMGRWQGLWGSSCRCWR